MTKKAAILRPAELPVIERGGGARTIPLVTEARGSERFLNGITSFGPGAEIPLHTHNCEESVVVLEGSAMFELDGTFHEMGPHDATWIPAEVPHRFINPSKTEGLKILWIYASIRATRTIVATGETRSIADEQAQALAGTGGGR